jgi:DNA replication protein DnaC
VLELAQGVYNCQAERLLMVGNPGLGNTHLGGYLALAACRPDNQAHILRFRSAESRRLRERLERERRDVAMP